MKGQQKHQHTWVRAGRNFKSDLTYYVSGNSNGKIMHLTYQNQILEPVVKSLLLNIKRDLIDPFILEEDGNSSHGDGSKRNLVRVWKEENKVKSYFNCLSSPYLSSIENWWQAPKQALRKMPHWNDITMRAIINEGWSHVSIEFIHKKVDTIPTRIQAVLDGHGAFTGY